MCSLLLKEKVETLQRMIINSQLVAPVGPHVEDVTLMRSAPEAALTWLYSRINTIMMSKCMGNYNVPRHHSEWCHYDFGIVLMPGVAGRGQARHGGPNDCAERIERKDREGRL